MAERFDRLLNRKPEFVGLHLGIDGKPASTWSRTALECGHQRNPEGAFVQRCEDCARISHPKTNPRPAIARPARRRAA